MEKEVFTPDSPLMYCPNCGEIISRNAVQCPKCNQRIFKESRWPIYGLVLGCILPIIAILGILAAVAIPAYQEYVEKSEAALEEKVEREQ
jgi:DNA-directed RNA polymerase subunit RPC12/RpoP